MSVAAGVRAISLVSVGVQSIGLVNVRAHAILEPEITLIDAGLVGSRRKIARELERGGRSLAELVRIVATHGHFDHAGGIAELEDDGVDVLMHPADYERLQRGFRDALRQPSRANLNASVVRPPRRIVPIEEGDVIPVLGGLRVVHTPGHTPGSVCLYAPEHRLLFTGDTLQVRRGSLTFASRVYSDDYAESRRSIRRLTDLDVGTIAFSHYPPLTEGANEALAALARRAEP